MNIIAAEIKPEIKLREVYYFRELNCNNVNLSWDYERVISNLNTISVMIYQELTTDIKGNPIQDKIKKFFKKKLISLKNTIKNRKNIKSILKLINFELKI